MQPTIRQCFLTLLVAASVCKFSVVAMLQYGSMEVFLRIVSHADSETQSMVRVSPAEYSRYRYPSEDF